MDRPANIVTAIYTARPGLRAVKSSGAVVTLSDGREYIDLMNGKGCITLGHHHPAVSSAIMNHLRDKSASATCWSDEHERLADRITRDLGLADSRLAFSSTGRHLVASAGYHGWGDDWASADELLAPNARGIVDFYFAPALLEELLDRYRDQVALVMLSPDYVHLTHATLKRLADIARSRGVLLCCDDVKQGYRAVRASAFPKAVGYHADLYTFAKGLANGQRLSCLVGRSDVIAAAREFTYTAYFDTIPIVAALATLDEMERCNGYQRLVDCGARLSAGLREVARASGLPVDIYGDGPMLQIVGATEALDQLVHLNCAAAGLLLYEGDNQAVSLATADVIDGILDRFGSALQAASRQIGPVDVPGITPRRRFAAAFCMMDGATDAVPAEDALRWIAEER